MKFSFWQLVGYSFGFGVLVAIVSAFLGNEYIPWAYLAGALYSLFGYIFLEWCIENLCSFFWDEDEMPSEPTPWMYVCAPFCPVALLIGAVVGTCISCIMYMCQMTLGRSKSA